MSVPPADRSVNLVIWALTWSALVGWQVITARHGELPSIVVVVRLLRRRFATRWLLLLGWGWLGWHLFVRTTF